MSEPRPLPPDATWEELYAYEHDYLDSLSNREERAKGYRRMAEVMKGQEWPRVVRKEMAQGLRNIEKIVAELEESP